MSPGILRNFNADLPLEESIAQTAEKLVQTDNIQVADVSVLLRYVSRQLSIKAASAGTKLL